MSSSARRPGLGAMSTRTREDAREEAGRIGSNNNGLGARGPATVNSPELAEPVDDAEVAAVESPPIEEPGTPIASTLSSDSPLESPARGARVSPRGRGGGRSAAPASLRPSRVQLRRVQIGPRLRDHVHEEFSQYVHDLANTGLTQSDIVESALVEYMAKYPPDVIRAALREDR